jgi:hypothetical protein
MKFFRSPVLPLFVVSALFAAPTLLAGDATAPTAVDSGSFGVFINNKRTATEKFSVEQGPDGSLVTTDFKTEEKDGTHQTTELKLGATGELRRYEFKDIAPGSAQAVLEPKDEFMIQHSTLLPTDKPEEHQYILPPTTNVLDDFVFIHREVLAWRFLAIGCRQKDGQVQCPLKKKLNIGVVIPRSRTSMLVGVEYSGRDSVSIHGKPRELNLFVLKSEASDWQLWLDDDYKVVRMVIPDLSTEIVRD